MNFRRKLTNIFSEYLDEEQMEVFNQNQKNFSAECSRVHYHFKSWTSF